MARSKDQKQTAALVALLDSKTLTEAAEKAGISRRTLFSYIHNDLEFARAYKAMQEEAATRNLEALEERREQASTVLMELVQDSKQPGAVRVKAAQAILQAASTQAATVDALAMRNIARNKEVFDMSID